MNLKEKLEKLTELQSDLKEAERVVMMKGGLMNDLIKDIATTHLGFAKDTQQFPLVDLLNGAYKAGSV